MRKTAGTYRMAQNVFWSTIYLGNFADIDPNEGNTLAENASGLLGTYGTIADPLWKERVTVETDSASSNIEEDNTGPNGIMRFDLGAGQISSRLDSTVAYDALVTFTDGSTAMVNIDLAQTQTGDVFLVPYFNETVLGTKPVRSFELQTVQNASYSGMSQGAFDDVEFVCFTPGTGIATPKGEVPVETLRQGDLVLTKDRGAQPIRWIGSRDLQFPRSPDTQKPIEIARGALDGSLPRRRLAVSPQHRVLLSGEDVLAACGQTEAFTIAKKLTDLRGVTQKKGVKKIRYFSLLLDRHEIIFAEGLPVESLHLGPQALSVLSRSQIAEIVYNVGEISERRSKSSALARIVMKGCDVKRLLRRRITNVQLSAQPTKNHSFCQANTVSVV